MNPRWKHRIRDAIRSVIPSPIRRALRPVLSPQTPIDTAAKGAHEVEFWESWVAEAGAQPETDYYRKFMMAMGDIRDQSFFEDKVCLDVGCGPKGSLTWLANARAAIGVDPLTEQYRRFGIDHHRMIYLSCGAERIPLATSYVDVVFSMNSLDHVDDVPSVCAEIRRVLKPGGYFIASLNLDEPATVTEPWTLTESLLEATLFHGWSKEFYEIRPKIETPEHFGPYRYFFEPCPPEVYSRPGPRALWCRFRTPSAEHLRLAAP